MSPTENHLRLPDWSRYRIIRSIGAGGGGSVFLAEDRCSGDRVALKRCAPGTGEQVAREASILAGIRFPGVVRLRDATVEPSDGAFLAVYEYIDGNDLLAATEGWELREIAGVLAQVLRALAFVHRRGLVHRDLKPENLLVEGRPPEARAVLIDFGLAVSTSVAEGVAGTLRYLAPEVLAGAAPDRRSDLYSFGIVFYQLLARCLPSDGLRGAEILRLHTGSDLRLPEPLAESLPQGVVSLVHTLLMRQPELRPTSAGEVLEALSRALDLPLPLETQATLRGRARSMEFPVPDQLAKGFADESGGAGPVVFSVPPGARALTTRWAAAAAAGGRPVCRWQAGAGSAVPDERELSDLLGIGGLLLLEWSGQAAPLELQLLSRLVARSSSGTGTLILVLEDDLAVPEPIAGAAPRVHLIPRPGREQVLERISRDFGLILEEEHLRWLRVGRTYSPQSVVQGLCERIDAGAVRADGEQPAWDRSRLLERGGAVVNRERALRKLAALPAALRAGLRSLALCTRPVPLELARRLADPPGPPDLFEALASSPWLAVTGAPARPASVILSSTSLAEALLCDLDDEGRRRLALKTAEVLSEAGFDDPETAGEIGLLLAEAGSSVEASRILLEAGVRLRAAGRSAEARRYLSRALCLCPVEGQSRQRVRCLRWLADCASLEGNNAQAELLAGEAAQWEGEADDHGRCQVVLARSQLRAGRLDPARRSIDVGLSIPGILPETRALLLAQRAIVLREDQDFDASVDAAREALDLLGPEPTLERAAVVMALANVHAHRAEVEPAADLYREAQQLGERLGRMDLVRQASSNLGRLLHEDGRSDQAVAALEPVLSSFDRAGVVQHCEEILVILMEAQSTLGNLSAVRELGLRGRAFFGEDSSQVSRSMFLRHLADAELCAGNSDQAEVLMRESVALREQAATTLVLATGQAALARVLSWRGQAAEARALLAGALHSVRAEREAVALVELLLSASGHHLVEGRLGAALRVARLGRKRAQAISPGLQGPRAAALCALASWRAGDQQAALAVADEVLAERPDVDADAARGLLLAVHAFGLGAAGDAVAADREFDRALSALVAEGRGAERAEALLIRAQALRDRAATRRLDASRAAVRTTAGDLARADAAEEEAAVLFQRLGLQAGLSRVAVLRSRDAVGPPVTASPEHSYVGVDRRIRTLDRLLEINAAINSEHDPRRLLSLILDESIELCGALRGFLILVRGTQIDVRVARNFAEQDIRQPEFQFSHSVARNVALSGESIRASNALHDQRLRSIASIAELKVSSILCVPLRGNDQVLGSIYLDHPDVIDRFDQGDLESLSDLASAAGVALERARLHQEIERLNAELMQTVEQQARELDEAKHTIEAERKAAAVRYDYRKIVTQSANMQEVLRLLDRITDTDFPVMIQGESGTGKELVARAIHFNGRRAGKNFVSVNCAAVAEPLIEAELFGHVKGAFTGADRDRPGMFEMADGGTLFLDEIGDMSLEVQKRLLRVVQHGEFFRVGGKATVKVNVRILSATHRDLKQLMKAGRFREDLYYRLNVAPVWLPPVRERQGDVALLINHFMQELQNSAGAEGVRLSKQALAVLERYSWPGNVREMQNLVKRLMILSGDRKVIDVDELPVALREESLRAGGPAPEGTLKDLMEGFERSVVESALRRAGGNKTEAARRLNVSLRGFYKILDRVGLGGRAASREDS